MLRMLIHQARYDLLAFLRNRQARFSTLILPPMVLFIFQSGFSGGGSDRVAGIAALGAFVACFANLVVSITAQRETGVLKRRHATPFPAWVFILGRSLTAIAAALASMTAVYVLGRAAYGTPLPAAALPAVALTAIVGSIAFASLAYAVATAIRSTDAAQPLVQAISLPLYVVSGVFVPAGDLPAGLHDLGTLFPLARLVHGLRHAALHGGAIAWGDLAVMAAWTAAGLAVALRRFRWAPAAAGA
jgi:ABC-2 type transport system permease protein